MIITAGAMTARNYVEYIFNNSPQRVAFYYSDR
jgi:hypothetical protein